MPKRNYKDEVHYAIMKKARDLELTAGNAEEIREAQARFFVELFRFQDGLKPDAAD